MSTTRDWEERDYALFVTIMTLMGGFYWAIRGTSGFGGAQGGLLAGTGWGLWWLWASHIGTVRSTRPYGSPWALFAIMMGTLIGGLSGYGVYTAWVGGNFQLSDTAPVREIAPWTGYAMLLLCGLHWGGNLGAFLAWCAPAQRATWQTWVLRIGCGVGGALAAWSFVRAQPQLFLPFYSEGIYSDPANKICHRTAGSAETIALHVGLFLGFLVAELIQRDRRAVLLMLTLALGFGIPFCVGGFWHTLCGASLQLDWWKNWEMTIGLGGGLSLGLAFFWFNQPSGTPLPALGRISTRFFGWGIPMCWALHNVLDNGFEGWSKNHQIPMGTAVSGIILVASIAFAFAQWQGTRILGIATDTWDSIVLPFIALQAVILLAGVAVSWPAAWATGNLFLLAAYSLYLGGSAICFWQLRQRL